MFWKQKTQRGDVVIDDVRGASLEATERLRELVLGVNGSVDDLATVVAVPPPIRAQPRPRRAPSHTLPGLGSGELHDLVCPDACPSLINQWVNRGIAKPTRVRGSLRFSYREALRLWVMNRLTTAGLVYSQARPMADAMIGDYIADAGRSVFKAQLGPGLLLTIDLAFAPSKLLRRAHEPE
jgi:hypothetical protein